VERILILHDYAGRRGGAEFIALDLRRLLLERGYDARLMTSTADNFAADDVPDFLCHGTNGRFRAVTETFNYSARSRLGQVMAQFRPDIVQVVMFLTQLSPAILPLLRNVPTVYSINTYRAICPKGTRWLPDRGVCTLSAGMNCRRAGCFGHLGVVPRLLQLELFRRSRDRIDMTIAPSRTMADILEANGWPVHKVIPHAVANHRRSQPIAATPLIGYAGRLVAEKGVDWLLTAFAEAGAALAQAQLLIVGDGPERAALTAQARRLGIADRTIFAGHRSRQETQSLLEPAWVQVIPSLWPEPFGLVAAEAMMRGAAVVTGDVGAPRDIVRDGVSGRVVRAGDTGALAGALTELALNPERTAAMGAAGRQIALDVFSEDHWVEEYIAAYGALARSEGVVR
jgi:glycosyltransferase involved in cell wall biosynthesis